MSDCFKKGFYIKNKLQNIKEGGGTKLYDALYRAVNEIHGKRKYLVLFTDGKDMDRTGMKMECFRR